MLLRTQSGKGILGILLAIGTLLPVSLSAQEIYQWTDEKGTIHFGQSPPQGAKDLQAKDRGKSRDDQDCEVIARQHCTQYDSDHFDADALQRCVESAIATCVAERRAGRARTPESLRQRIVVTPPIHTDPNGEQSLRCAVTCRVDCDATVRIVDRASSRTLVEERHQGRTASISTSAKNSGEVYCRVGVDPDSGASVVLEALRGTDVVSRVQAGDSGQ